MNQLLWKPTQARIEQANITQFIDNARVNHQANIRDYASLYQWSIDKPKKFWNAVWDFSGIVSKTRGSVLSKNSTGFTNTHWYPHARLNFTENLLQHYGSEPAIIFQGEDRIKNSLSWNDLHDQVASFTAALKAAGVKKGDRVAALLPNIPEAIIALLATASLGAIWVSCSPDFDVASILGRFSQITPKILITADGYYHHSQCYDLANKVERILEAMPYVDQTIWVSYVNFPEPQCDHVITLEAFTAPYQEVEQTYIALPFEHPLYILYSPDMNDSPPQGIVHSAGGTLLQHAKEHLLHVDVHAGYRLFYLTSCDRMMWHWLVSGLVAGATLVLYDGAPLYPNHSALFELIDNEKIDIFGISSQYLNTLRQAGYQPAKAYNLGSLKTILSTDSPFSSENFDFVYQNIKQDVCLSFMSTKTDIIACPALGTPILPVWRGEIQCPGLGMKLEIFDHAGDTLESDPGELVCTAPFPSMPLGFWNDSTARKLQNTYFKRYPDTWHSGDSAELTPHGGLIIRDDLIDKRVLVDTKPVESESLPHTLALDES